MHALATGPVLAAPELVLTHRRLLVAAGIGDLVALADHAAALVAALLNAPPAPAIRTRQRHLVDQARQALYAGPARRLTALATELAVSPYHLSRVFHRVTGVTLSDYRTRLRVQRAIDRLARGDASAGQSAVLG
ncbi:MAG: helix-turn-helix domain-containing protein, partial [Micromonosporaceae bacterium]